LKEKIKLLMTLQDFDTRIGYILVQKEEGPKKIERLEQRLTDLETKLAEETRQVEAVTRDRRETEQKIEEAENKLKKADIKLSSIKSNKEYHAALKEIDDLKKAKFILEDKAIEMMEQLEALEGACAASREQAVGLKRQFEMERDAVTRSLKALDEELHALEQKRVGVSQAVDMGLLKRYDMIRERKGGIAVSPVIQGVCQTCHIRIPPQEFNELIRGDKLMSCPNCTRMIYWGDDDQYKAEESEKND
jgi:predicted  nucleic acid-binding Zn-ribbon protein